MTAAYTPQIGDRLVIDARGRGRWFEVAAIDRGYLWGFDCDGFPATFMADENWVKVTPPPTYPERWINVYPDYVLGGGWVTRAAADLETHNDRIAVIHLAADGTVTLHPVERES